MALTSALEEAVEIDGSLPFQVESLVGKETQKMITVPGTTDCKEVGGKGKRQVCGRRSGIQRGFGGRVEL